MDRRDGVVGRLWIYVLGFATGTLLCLLFFQPVVRGKDQAIEALRRQVAVLVIERQGRGRVESWRSRYGRWVPLVEWPSNDPPPAGALSPPPPIPD